MKTTNGKTTGSYGKRRESRVDPLIMMSIALGVILACFAALMAI